MSEISLRALGSVMKDSLVKALNVTGDWIRSDFIWDGSEATGLSEVSSASGQVKYQIVAAKRQPLRKENGNDIEI
jgi:hypothetical protein